MDYITSDALEFILEAARSLHPREFTAKIRQDDDGVITEVIVLPGSTYGDGFGRYLTSMVPIDRSIVGSVHSHPSNNFSPSQTDVRSFGKSGRIHLIVRYPYAGLNDVAAYDNKGERIELGLK